MPVPVLLLLFKLPIGCSDLVRECCDKVDSADEDVGVGIAESSGLLPLLLPLTTRTEEAKDDEVGTVACFKDDVDVELLKPTP